MNVADYEKRYERILSMKITKAERVKMCTGLLEDLKRALDLPLYKKEFAEEENAKIQNLYRKIFEECR